MSRTTHLIRSAAAFLLAGTLSAMPSTGQTLDVVHLGDMDFGDVGTGGSSTVLYSDAGASVFRLDCTGMAGFQRIDVTFTLPTQIVNGGDTIPISFGGTTAAWSYTNDPSGATAFSPGSGASISKNGSIFSVYVWIGATINPNGATPSQAYANTFTLDAEIQ